MIHFFKENLLRRFRVSRAIIGDESKYYCNKSLASLMKKYEIIHKVATPYHPQIRGHVELANREIKQILEKMINPNHKNWSLQLIATL